MGGAGLRLGPGAGFERRERSKPSVLDFDDPETQAILRSGYPGLRRGIREASHFNIGWIAHWLDRLDQGFARNRAAAPTSSTAARASNWSGQLFATFEDDRAGVLTREETASTPCSGQRLPAPRLTWPSSREVRGEIFDGVPDDEVRAMTVESAARLYGFPLEV